MSQQNIPTFDAWSHKNLAEFATDAYIKLQEQQYELEQERLNSKATLDAMQKLLKESGK
jgi:hypothetical protein